MQNFKFESYVEFFDYLRPEDQVMTEYLKEIIENTIPEISYKLSWNVPFFKKNKTICYIWPGSVPWGKKTFEGVQLGFNQAYKMKANNYLEKGSRKQIHTKTFYSLEDIENDLEIIIALLKEANEIDKIKGRR
ncbi:MAG: DUF1801 domain-containing protein [Crocinitomicaceae bacterium]